MNRCGRIALVGAPNAGKSTLVNALVGEKVAIVSAKVQTTRQRLIGIATVGEAQLLLIDTPGIHKPRRRLDRAMVRAAWDGAADADVILFVVDGAAGFKEAAQQILEALTTRTERKFIVLNKVDIAKKPKLLDLALHATALVPFEEVFMVSAETGDGVDDLRSALAKSVPETPWVFPADQLTDATTRLMAAELTREQIFQRLHAELPYACAVETEKWQERKDGSLAIHQQILVERDSQRAIVLGKAGAMLKAIGSASRAEIARLTGSTVHLFLHVKVKAGWADDSEVLAALGLD